MLRLHLVYAIQEECNHIDGNEIDLGELLHTYRCKDY